MSICVYVHACMHISVYPCTVHVCMCVVYICLCMYMCAAVYVRVSALVHAYMFLCMRACMCMRNVYECWFVAESVSVCVCV